MNSFDSDRELEILKVISPVADRETNADELLQKAFSKIEAAPGATSSPTSSRAQMQVALRNLTRRFSIQGLAVAASVAVVAVVGASLVAGNVQNRNRYLFSTGGAQATTKMNANGDALGAKSAVVAAALAMPAFSLNYVAGPGLSTQSGSSHIFEIVADGDPKVVAAALADYFGIEGGITRQDNEGSDWVQYVPTKELQQQENPQGQSVIPQSMYVSASGEYLSFGYNDNSSYNWSNCQIQMDPMPDYCNGIKEEPLPSLEEAKTQAGQILNKLGLKWGSTIGDTPSGGYLLDASYQDQQYGMVAAYAASDSAGDTGSGTGSQTSKSAKSILVTASLLVARKATPIQIQFTWVPGYSKLASMYGEIAKAIDRGSFDTISASQTVARLNQFGYGGQVNLDWNNLKWSSKTFQEMPDSMRQKVWACSGLGVVPEPRAAITGSATEASSGSVDGASGEASIAPTPVESASATCDLPTKNGLVQIDATVTKSEETQVMIWDSKGGRWLVPGFNFYDDTGYLASAFSVVDGVIKIDAPSMQPMTK